MADRPDDLDIQAERLRAADALGRSDTINRLFAFLLVRSREGPPPKEIEVAEAVFGRRVSFDIAQDSTVRVNVHRLRKKLDDFYAGPGRDEPVRLTLPKGEYRLVVAPQAAPVELTPPPLAAGLFTRAGLALAASLAVLCVACGWGWWASAHDGGLGFARRSPAWRVLLADDRPITVVAQDDFIFGQTDEHGDVSRLVREFNINSSEDLAEYMMNNPDKASHYIDLGYYYLPTSVAPAMRDIMPFLAINDKERDRVRVVTSSQLTPDLLKRSDIVYIGDFAGLRLLRDQVFAGSRYRIGSTFDDLTDTKTGKTYHSPEGEPESPEARPDFGYFSTFTGPNGNRFVIISGTRDVGVMHTAEAVSAREGLKLIADKAKGMDGFEVLYQAQAVDRVNFMGQLLNLSPIPPAKSWSNQPLTFPQG